MLHSTIKVYGVVKPYLQKSEDTMTDNENQFTRELDGRSVKEFRSPQRDSINSENYFNRSPISEGPSDSNPRIENEMTDNDVEFVPLSHLKGIMLVQPLLLLIHP